MKLLFFTLRNWAETDEPGDAELSNIVLPLTPDETLRRIEDVVRTLPCWRVEKADAATGEIHLTRRTRLFRFVDDIRLRLEAVPGGTRLRGRSQARLGFTDLGQNRRNLKALVAALRQSGRTGQIRL
ncbi:MAG: DUF1499 domain-containing protein [Planctomycetes bacterium]|nr:DUF1499 domain-containing protein [Planctomycetota bacterium]